MTEGEALKLSHQILSAVFQKQSKETLNQIFEKYAFDAKLPYQVQDSTTGEITWADSVNFDHYITLANSFKMDMGDGWKLKKVSFHSFDEILKCFDKINYVTTERVYNSENVSKSDTIYRCFNVYHSVNCNDSSNLVFDNGLSSCDYMLASSRSFQCSYSIRCDDSTNCSNSYNVICSDKISNSFFIQDCSNLNECMFCAHISNASYCICNMQFEKEEYLEIKKELVAWICNS